MKNRFAATRRRAVCTAALALLAIGNVPASSWAAENAITMINAAAAKANIETTPLRGGLSMLSGSGGNITVYNSSKGKLMVDAGINVSHAKLEAAVKQLGPAPIKYLINTHWHWDHADGNVWVRKTGPVTIISHPAALPDMSRVNVVNFWPYTFAPLAKSARPTQFVDKERVIRLGEETITITALGSGHTSGDLWVRFAKANVLATGDIFWNGIYPFIDNEHGGGIDDTINWSSKAVDLSNDDTIIVPGHGPVASRADLIDYRDMLVGIRDKVKALKAQGKGLDEVLAAKPTAAYDAKYGQFLIGPDVFTRLVYEGIK